VTALSALGDLWRRGADLSTDRGDILCRSPTSLPLELLAALREQKPEILKILTLMGRLQTGSRWLLEQHYAWLADRTDAAGDPRFSEALAGWDQLERELRLTGYPYCVFGRGGRCPLDAPAVCDACQLEQRRAMDYLRGELSLEDYLRVG
jgi:hypothetical protein